MAEISEAPATTQTKESESEQPSEPSNFDPETMRKTKPGLKRLILTLSVLFSFLLGLPLLLKSVEIYRSPLPFRDIDSLSVAIESTPILFPCHFHAVFVNFPHKATPSPSGNQLGFAIHSRMQKLFPNTPLCGACSNFSVAVTLDSNSLSNGLLSEFNKNDRDLENFDEDLDEYLKSVLNEDRIVSKNVYTVAVVNREDVEEVRAVVGKYRHAWIEGRIGAEEEVVERIADIFVKVFVNGGKEEGSIHGEFMPVEADGRVVLSFNLLNADPRDWIYDWDFQSIEEILLAPVVEALRPLADVSVESQLPNGEFSLTNGFISPMWGGVVVWNPPACLNVSESTQPLRHMMSPKDMKMVFEIFTGQPRQIFGLKSDTLVTDASGTSLLLASERGFAEWELDVLSRQHTCFNLLQCATTLGSLSRLVQSLPRMIIMDEIGKQVKFSLVAAKLTLRNASLGIYDASSVSSRQARSLAEDAFYHPSMIHSRCMWFLRFLENGKDTSKNRKNILPGKR